MAPNEEDRTDAPDDEVAQEEALRSKAAGAKDEETGNADKGAEQEELPPKCKRSTKILCGTIGLLVVAAVVVVVVLMTYDGRSSSSSSAQNNDNGGDGLISVPTSLPPVAPSQPIFASPTVAPAPIAPAPTAAPTSPSPTVAPTTSAPSATPTEDIRAELLNFFFDNGVVVSEENTAGSLAVSFLAEEAASENALDLSTPEKIIQRYALVTLEYSLRGAAETTDAPTPNFVPLPEPEPDAPLDGDADFFANETSVENPTESDGATGMGGGFLGQFGGARKLQSLVALGRPGVDECFWVGVTCANDTIVEIRLGNKGFDGSIPTEIGLMTNLTYLDLSQNDLGGSIPEELYSLTNLVELFLYQNQLTGTISRSAGNFWNLRHFHLNHNQLTGSIPASMASDVEIRAFRKLCLLISFVLSFVNHSHFFVCIPILIQILSISRAISFLVVFLLVFAGEIYFCWIWDSISSLGLCQLTLARNLLVYDVSFATILNVLACPFWCCSWCLSHVFTMFTPDLALDHNQFTGTLPLSYINVGNGRLESFAINDNALTGAIPDDHNLFNKLVQFTLQNNNFNDLNGGTCQLAVFIGGENVELKADCDICNCRAESACNNC